MTTMTRERVAVVSPWNRRGASMGVESTIVDENANWTPSVQGTVVASYEDVAAVRALDPRLELVVVELTTIQSNWAPASLADLDALAPPASTLVDLDDLAAGTLADLDALAPVLALDADPAWSTTRTRRLDLTSRRVDRLRGTVELELACAEQRLLDTRYLNTAPIETTSTELVGNEILAALASIGVPTFDWGIGTGPFVAGPDTIPAGERIITPGASVWDRLGKMLRDRDRVLYVNDAGDWVYRAGDRDASGDAALVLDDEVNLLEFADELQATAYASAQSTVYSWWDDDGVQQRTTLSLLTEQTWPNRHRQNNVAGAPPASTGWSVRVAARNLNSQQSTAVAIADVRARVDQPVTIDTAAETVTGQILRIVTRQPEATMTITIREAS